MAKKKSTRRSISVKGLTYQDLDPLAKALHEKCLIDAPSRSGALEYLIGVACKEHGIERSTVLRAFTPSGSGPKRDRSHQAGGIFTF